MGSFSIWHWLIVIAVILLLFGRGKVSELMGDTAKGIRAFKKGLAEDETKPTEAVEHRREDAAESGEDRTRTG